MRGGTGQSRSQGWHGWLGALSHSSSISLCFLLSRRQQLPLCKVLAPIMSAWELRTGMEHLNQIPLSSYWLSVCCWLSFISWPGPFCSLQGWADTETLDHRDQTRLPSTVSFLSQLLCGHYDWSSRWLRSSPDQETQIPAVQGAEAVGEEGVRGEWK